MSIYLLHTELLRLSRVAPRSEDSVPACCRGFHVGIFALAPSSLSCSFSHASVPIPSYVAQVLTVSFRSLGESERSAHALAVL